MRNINDTETGESDFLQPPGLCIHIFKQITVIRYRDVGVAFRKNFREEQQCANASGIQISPTEMGFCNNTKPLLILSA